jgi:signal transduction histidine kinase
MVAAGECMKAGPRSPTVLDPLTPPHAITDNSFNRTRRLIALEAPDVETLQDTLHRLRREIEQLHASRRRLVVGADADRRSIERALHNGAQQHLVALAVNLQLAAALVERDPVAARTLLEEMRRDVQGALDETAQLAGRIYPQLLELRGLAAELRAAALSAGIRASVDVSVAADHAPEIATAAYLCCLEALEPAGAGTRATVTVRTRDGTLTFDVFADGEYSDAGTELLRDRVEALGGQLTVRSEPGGATHVSGSLPG